MTADRRTRISLVATLSACAILLFSSGAFADVPHMSGDPTWGENASVRWSIAGGGVLLSGTGLSDLPALSSNGNGHFGAAWGEVQSEISAAFDDWEHAIEASGGSIDFTQVADPGSAFDATTPTVEIRIFFAAFTEPAGSNDPPEWVGGVGWSPDAVGSSAVGGNVVLDINDFWQVGNSAGGGSAPQYNVADARQGLTSGFGGDFYALVTHEIGHTLGMGHATAPDDTSSIMRPNISPYVYDYGGAYVNPLPYNGTAGTGVINDAATINSVSSLYGGGSGVSPEPSSLLLAAVALAGLAPGLFRRKGDAA